MNEILDSEKLILVFLYIWEKPIRAGDLFIILKEKNYFTRSRQTLNSSLNKLTKLGLIHYQKYRLIELTNIGRIRAAHIKWHMHLLELFFQKTLDLSQDKIDREILRLTPVVSCAFIRALVKKYHDEECELQTLINEENCCVEGGN
ncbi:MAG: metal-dependent transcriptional regulator [Candidatus Hodarchaeales archaeon]